MRETLFTENQVLNSIKNKALDINNFYSETPVTFVIVLGGGMWFAVELMKHLTLTDFRVEYVRVKSYVGTLHTRTRVKSRPLEENIKGRECLILDDIYDTGDTLMMSEEVVREGRPAGVNSLVLIKRDQAEGPNSCLIANTDKFLYGWGMDDNETGRHQRSITA